MRTFAHAFRFMGEHPHLLLEKTGQLLAAIDVAKMYGFTDTSGVVPSPL